MWPKAGVTEGTLSRCFLLSRNPDETFLVAQLCVSLFSEWKRKVKSWLIYMPRLLATVVFTGLRHGQVWSKKRQQRSKWRTSIFMVFKENPLRLPGMMPLTVFLSEKANILVDHDGENPVAWIKSTNCCPGEIPSNLWHYEMINSDTNKDICSNKSLKRAVITINSELKRKSAWVSETASTLPWRVNRIRFRDLQW